jgi:hypothetical protein
MINKLLAFTLIFITTEVYSFENKGLHKLNPFPLKDWVSRTYLKHEKASINLNQSLTQSKTQDEYRSLIEEEIGKRLTANTYFAIAMAYGESSFATLREGESTFTTYRARGFMEPRFSLYSRRKWADGEGEPVVDIAFSYTPGLTNKEVGEHGADNYNGRDILNFKVSHGTFYQYWDFNINLQYDYYGEGKFKNLKDNSKSSYESYSEFTAQFEAQNYITASYFARAGVGLRLIGDQDIVTNVDTRTVQQGTGSSLYIGVVHKSKTYTSLLKLSRLRNDYFIKSNDGNLEGDYTFRTISYEYLKEF